MSKLVVTVSGPSASGKTELVNSLCKDFNFQKLVSITTRLPRTAELHGVEYYFITEEEFKAEKSAGNLAQEVEFRGKFYATTSSEITRVFSSGKIPIVIVEPGGVGQMQEVGKRLGFDVFSLFVHAPYETLKKRFMDRLDGVELSDYDKIRLEAVKKESEEWYDACDWNMKVCNSGSDISNVSWIAKQVNLSVDEVKKTVEL